MKWIALMLLAGLISACATIEDVKLLDRENRLLGSQVSAVRKDMESLKKDVLDFQKELIAAQNENKKEIGSLKEENKSLKADLLLRLDNLQSEVKILTSGVEEYKDFIRKPSKEIDRMREDVVYRTKILEERWGSLDLKNRSFEERIRALEERMKTLEEGNKELEQRILRPMDDRLKDLESRLTQSLSKRHEPERIAAREAQIGKQTLSSSSTSAYKDAYDTFQKGDFDAARRKFEAFLKQYPNTELSDNAQFWIGETYYQQRDFERAIVEYEKAIAKYPEGDKIPSALLKQALSFYELGDRTNARNLLKRLIERYPDSDQAEMAKKKLETIK